jgi:hypothetical protein
MSYIDKCCTEEQPHRFNSGVYWDTAPGEALSCCEKWSGHPIHNVPCRRCDQVHGVTYQCPPWREGGVA